MTGQSVVSPLVALMKDQVAHCLSRGLTAGYISSDSSDTMKKEILEGKCQVVFISPESLFTGRRWRDMLRQEPYRSNLVGFIVDEAHCVKKWCVPRVFTVVIRVTAVFSLLQG